jgi:hypothetical protein
MDPRHHTDKVEKIQMNKRDMRHPHLWIVRMILTLIGVGFYFFLMWKVLQI